jgi:hypothetical protein
LIPGTPQAVGRTQVRFAELGFEIVGREDELLERLLLRRIDVVGIECIDDERAIYLDWLGFVGTVDHDPRAKPANGGQAGLMEHRVGPDGDDALGRRQFIILVLPRPPQLVDTPRTATTGSQSSNQEHNHKGRAELGVLSDHRRGSFHALGCCGPKLLADAP